MMSYFFVLIDMTQLKLFDENHATQKSLFQINGLISNFNTLTLFNSTKFFNKDW